MTWGSIFGFAAFWHFVKSTWFGKMGREESECPDFAA
jgi:hypothetical protein